MKKGIIVLLVFLSAISYSQDMNNSRLGQLITQYADSVNVGSVKGAWQFYIKEKTFMCMTDSTANRMRIISPIASVQELQPEHLLNSLAANFHTALDVKYAVSNSIMWTVFIHPLKDLSDNQIKSAIYQVYNSNLTFGTSYQSTNLIFNPKGSSTKQDDKLQLLQENVAF